MGILPGTPGISPNPANLGGERGEGNRLTYLTRKSMKQILTLCNIDKSFIRFQTLCHVSWER